MGVERVYDLLLRHQGTGVERRTGTLTCASVGFRSAGDEKFDTAAAFSHRVNADIKLVGALHSSAWQVHDLVGIGETGTNGGATVERRETSQRMLRSIHEAIHVVVNKIDNSLFPCAFFVAYMSVNRAAYNNRTRFVDRFQSCTDESRGQCI